HHHRVLKAPLRLIRKLEIMCWPTGVARPTSWQPSRPSKGDRATVVFDGSSGDNFVKFPSEVMAIPTAPVKVMPGDYVLAQYPFQKQMWTGGRVNSVGGATVNVKFSNSNAASDVPANMLVKAPEVEIPAIKKELNQ